MIWITNKHNCCGCTACVQVCPKQYITMQEDEKGFLYPKVDDNLCINCGLCEKVCPMLNSKEKVEPQQVCAAINPDEEIRRNSSSGGVFTMLAESVIKEGGVVFGAIWNEQWEVVHSYTESLDGLSAFRGAKYSQSIIGDTYRQAQKFLKAGRKVLFSGTGCQIAGLKFFLRKEYDNLLTVEIACHGVPSPKVWKEYVKKVSDGKQLTNIVFRDKRNGWNGYGLSVVGTDGKELMYEPFLRNDFLQSMLNDLCIRPSCTNCPAKAGASGADLLIGDFWGVEGMHPDMYDNKGCSLVIAYTNVGKTMFGGLDLREKEVTYEEGCRYNPCIVQSIHESRYAPIFWYNFRNHGIEAAPKTLRILKSNRIARILTLQLYKFKIKYGY